MRDATNDSLLQAFQLIEAEKLDEARALLQPILTQQPNNPDAWWLYAHAVSEVDSARHALNTVLRLDPNYPEATELLQTLERTFPAHAVPSARATSIRPTLAPVAPRTLPDLPETGEELPDFDDEAEEKPRRGLPRLVLIAGLLILVMGVAAVLILLGNPFRGSGTSTATPSGTQVTSTAVATSLDEFEPIYGALAAFNVPEGGIEVAETNLSDNTILATICTAPGPEMRSTLPTAMAALASESSALPSDVQAIGVRMTDCDSNTVFLVIAVPTADAMAFAAGNLSEQDFQARWRSQ